MNFHHKGHLVTGADADLLVLDEQQRINHVMAQGQWHVFNKQQIKTGMFEK